MEKDKDESKIMPKLRTDLERGNGRRGGEIRGGWKTMYSDFDWFSKRRLEDAQEEISDKTSDKIEEESKGNGRRI